MIGLRSYYLHFPAYQTKRPVLKQTKTITRATFTRARTVTYIAVDFKARLGGDYFHARTNRKISKLELAVLHSISIQRIFRGFISKHEKFHQTWFPSIPRHIPVYTSHATIYGDDPH